MWPLVTAAAGMALNDVGKSQGANATAHQIDVERQQEEALAAQRRASILTALKTTAPAQQLATAQEQALRTSAPQQAQAQAIARAYGIDNPATADAMQALGPSIDDAAWGRAFGFVNDQNRQALNADYSRERGMDDQQWWLQRFAPNRIQRAGNKGADLRMIGSLLEAYGLGKTNQAMAKPAAPSADDRIPIIATQSGSNATNAETGARITDGLQDQGWLEMGGAAPQQTPAWGGSSYGWPSNGAN